jgi:hypothetical protein
LLAEAAGKGKDMQRYKLNIKGGTYTESNAYELVPIFRQQVVPGQTVNISAEVNVKSAAFNQNVSTPALGSMWFFYVPHRLVWNEWTDFLAKVDTLPTFPTTNVDSKKFFDIWQATNSGSALYRRAYKQVYNEYFGSENIGQASYSAWYDDITADSEVDLGKTRNPEQFASKMQLEGTVVDPEFTVVSSSIPLNDFYRQMMNARSTQRSQMTGDKYVDTLARMGVDASWMIAERPEFLGTKSMLVGPQLTANTSDTNTGEEAARFQTKISCQIKNKHFAEHGYIVGVASLRPIISFTDRGAADSFTTASGGNSDQDWLDSFYSADNLQTKDVVWNLNNGWAAPNDVVGYTDRFAYLKKGQWLEGNGNSWTLNVAASTIQTLIYPSVAMPVTTELGTNEVAFTSSINLSGLTPVPQRVA